jgi:hypothetical protein
MHIGNIAFKDLESVKCFKIKLYLKYKRPEAVHRDSKGNQEHLSK